MRSRNRKFIKKHKVQENRINQNIRLSTVRLVQDGDSKTMSLEDALKLAEEQELDLVEIAVNGQVSIVKIVDYGKFKFNKNKLAKENTKKMKSLQIKEVKLGPKTDTDDFKRKCREAISFLEKGNTVKISMRFRGREMAHTNLGKQKMEEFAEELKPTGVLDKPIILQGRMMSMFFRSHATPKKKKELSEINSESTE